MQICVPGWCKRSQSFLQISPKVPGNLEVWAGQDQTINSQQFSLSHRKSASRPYASKPWGCLFVFLSFPQHKWFQCTCSCLLWMQGHCECVYKWTSLACILQHPYNSQIFVPQQNSTRSWLQRSPVCLSTLQLTQMCSAGRCHCVWRTDKITGLGSISLSHFCLSTKILGSCTSACTFCVWYSNVHFWLMLEHDCRQLERWSWGQCLRACLRELLRLGGASRDCQSRLSRECKAEIKQLDSSDNHHESRPVSGFLSWKGTAVQMLVRKRWWEGDMLHFRKRDKKNFRQLGPKGCRGGRKGT